MTGAVDENEEIARCVIFPKAFQDSVHTDELLFVFGSSGDDGASHESGVLCRLAPADEDIHRTGCKIAANQNARLGVEPGDPKRRYYCAFRRARAKDVAIKSDRYWVTLTLDNEGGEPAHIDIALFVVDDASRNERATLKSEAGLILAEAFGPPFEHICEVDTGDPLHPLRIDPDCLTRGVPRLQSPQGLLALGG